MTIMTHLANFFAKHSVDRWNRYWPLRKLCRSIYQGMSAIYIFRTDDHRYIFGGRSRSEFEPKLFEIRPDTYPWPYSKWIFAHWEECDIPGSYTLVPDPAGFVVHYSTSYCAWKIRERTGRWPKRRQPGVTYHAKDWQAFLAENGYTEIIDSPAESLLQNCIGIDPDCGDFGQVYWYEGARLVKTEDNPLVCAGFNCSTYENRVHNIVCFGLEEAKKLIWVKIC